MYRSLLWIFILYFQLFKLIGFVQKKKNMINFLVVVVCEEAHCLIVMIIEMMFTNKNNSHLGIHMSLLK